MIVALFDSILAVAITWVALSGLLITYSILRFINLAHGEMIAIGAYCVSIPLVSSQPTLLRCIIAFFSAMLVGACFEYLLVRRLIAGEQAAALLGTWGVSIAMQEGLRILFGGSGRFVKINSTAYYSILGTEYPVYRVLVLFYAFAILLAIYVFFKSIVGIKVFATIDDQEIAETYGIDTQKYFKWVFLIGSGLAGVAGALIAPIVSVHPMMGAEYTTIGFVAILTGGGRGIVGPLVACAMITTARTMILFFCGANLATIAVYCFAVLIVVGRNFFRKAGKIPVTWKEEK